MNRTLPTRDRGNRRGDSGGSSRCGRVVSGAFGLVGGVAHSRKRETPPSRYPAARCEEQLSRSGFDGVAALPILAFGGRDREAHLLANRAGKEPAQGMWLPASGFEQFLGAGSPRPLQEVEDRRGFTALAGFVSCAPRRFLLRGRLPLAGATLARRAPAAGFFVAFAFSPGAVAGAVPVSSVIDVVILNSPSAVITAITTWITQKP